MPANRDAKCVLRFTGSAKNRTRCPADREWLINASLLFAADKIRIPILNGQGATYARPAPESEQIAGVVQNIRNQGFDVLLMLEATIGLNEVETQPGEDGAADELVEGKPFTAQDVNFLKSLRISVEGEDVEDEDDSPSASSE